MKPTFYPKNIIMQIRFQIIFTIFFFHCIVVQVFAQKHDYNIIFGDIQIKNIGYNNGLLLDFNYNPISQSTFKLNMSYLDCVMSDKDGKLIFYTNGCFIANKNHTTMLNGDSLNWDDSDHLEWSTYCNAKKGLFYTSEQLCLPDPQNENLYYIFSFLIDKNTYPIKLFQTKIDMNKDSGLGMVIEKNKVIAIDTFSHEQVPLACKHGNGKDWWIVIPNFSPQDTSKWDNTYSFFLLNQEGVKFHHKQDIGTKWGSWQWNGQSRFSPDGSKFVRYNPYNGLQIFDFDRCSGYFSNPKSIYLPRSPRKDPWNENSNTIDTGFIFGGASFSPNSKLLYLSTAPILYQFNLEENDISSTRTIVGSYDTVKYRIDGTIGFFEHTMTSDGRIFIQSTYIDYDYQHVINKPNELGKNCDFQIKGFKLLSPNIEYINHFPNYRLGPLKGSPCDTILGVANKDISPDTYQIKLFPNPASTDIKIDITLKEYDPAIKTEVVIVDISGAIVQKYTMPDFAYLATIDISKLASGVYGVQLRQPKRFGERVLAVEKLVVIR